MALKEDGAQFVLTRGNKIEGVVLGGYVFYKFFLLNRVTVSNLQRLIYTLREMGWRRAQVQGYSKGIRIQKSGTFVLVESGIWEIFLVDSRILSCGIRNTAQRIRMPLTNGIQNPSSTDSDSRIHYLGYGILGLESRIQNCQAGLPYMVSHFCYNFVQFLGG